MPTKVMYHEIMKDDLAYIWMDFLAAINSFDSVIIFIMITSFDSCPQLPLIAT